MVEEEKIVQTVQTMKKLTKIKLINWHYFQNETINVDGSFLLSGENASGKSTILDAIQLAEEGKCAQEIYDILMQEKLEASIYITVDTLKYLKKGGRITPAAAAIGTVLNLKPVLQIQGEKLDAFAKVRGWKTAKKTMLDAVEKDMKTRFAGKEMKLAAAYTCSEETAQEWKKEIEQEYAKKGEQVKVVFL